MHSTERTAARGQVEAGTPSLLVLFSVPARGPFHPGQLTSRGREDTSHGRARALTRSSFRVAASSSAFQ